MTEQPPAKPEQEVHSATPKDSADGNPGQIMSFSAGGLIVCFFLPWIQILFSTPSGFDLANEGGKYLLLWSIPIFSGLTIAAGMAKQSQKTVGQLTGALPLIVLGFGLADAGMEMLKLLQIGAWVGLPLGVVMFVRARRLK